MGIRTFSRFKYAEEYAHDIDNAGKQFVFKNDPNHREFDGTVEYEFSQYTVEEVDG